MCKLWEVSGRVGLEPGLAWPGRAQEHFAPMNVALWSRGMAGAWPGRKVSFLGHPESSRASPCTGLLWAWGLSRVYLNTAAPSVRAAVATVPGWLVVFPKWEEHWLSVLGPGASGFPGPSPALEGEPQRRCVCLGQEARSVSR